MIAETYTVFSRADARKVYGQGLTLVEAAVMMLTAGGAHSELRGELWRGPWELWVASPKDVAGGVIGGEMTRAPFPPIYGILSDAWLEIADIVLHADLWLHLPLVATDEEYLAITEPVER
jgi:hypothetical protein